MKTLLLLTCLGGFIGNVFGDKKPLNVEPDLPALPMENFVFGEKPDEQVQQMLIQDGVVVVDNPNEKDLQMMANNGEVCHLTVPQTGAVYKPKFDTSDVINGSKCTISDFEQVKNGSLGRGSFGKVFLAKHRKTNKVLVVKEQVYRTVFTGSYAREERFQHELAQVCHNIAPVHCAEVNSGKVYFYMDQYQGGDLEKRSERGEYKDKQKWANVAAQIILAIHLTHKHNIAHLDIKPANIFVKDNGDALIADFGCAQHGEGASFSGIVGTPAYIAPEIFKGDPYGRAVDIYSFACVGYFMYTGQLPHPFKAGETLPSYSKRVIDSKTFPAVDDPQINKVLQVCGDYNPDNRWKNVSTNWVEFRKMDIWKGTCLDPAIYSTIGGVNSKRGKRKGRGADKAGDSGGIRWYWWVLIGVGGLIIISLIIWLITTRWRRKTDSIVRSECKTAHLQIESTK